MRRVIKRKVIPVIDLSLDTSDYLKVRGCKPKAKENFVFVLDYLAHLKDGYVSSFTTPLKARKEAMVYFNNPDKLYLIG